MTSMVSFQWVLGKLRVSFGEIRPIKSHLVWLLAKQLVGRRRRALTAVLANVPWPHISFVLMRHKTHGRGSAAPLGPWGGRWKERAGLMANDRHVWSWKCSTLPKTAYGNNSWLARSRCSKWEAFQFWERFVQRYLFTLSTARSQEAQEASFCTGLEFPG